MKEFSESEAEKAAAKLELPVFTGEIEIYHATEWAKIRAKTVALVVLGVSEMSLKREWKAKLKQLREQKRFEQWLELNNGHWDERRGKYICFN